MRGQIVRCKATANSSQSMSTGPNGDSVATHNYSLYGVYSADPNHENRKYWEGTPAFSLQMTIVGDRLLENGKEYYVDILDEETAQDRDATTNVLLNSNTVLSQENDRLHARIQELEAQLAQATVQHDIVALSENTTTEEDTNNPSAS